MGQLRQRELERAVNLVGAHRDDLTLFLGHLPAKGFASHGEQWSLALALRLASFELMRADSALTSIDGKSEDPILILDDVFRGIRYAQASGLVADGGPGSASAYLPLRLATRP